MQSVLVRAPSRSRCGRLYWAADYTCRYPDALFSRCVVTAGS
jgi:hypothetical protein